MNWREKRREVYRVLPKWERFITYALVFMVISNFVVLVGVPVPWVTVLGALLAVQTHFLRSILANQEERAVLFLQAEEAKARLAALSQEIADQLGDPDGQS